MKNLILFFLVFVFGFSFVDAASFPRQFMFGPTQAISPLIYTSNIKVAPFRSMEGDTTNYYRIIGSGLSDSIPNDYYQYFMTDRYVGFNGFPWLIFKPNPSPDWAGWQGSNEVVSMSYVDRGGEITEPVDIPTNYNQYDINAFGFYFYNVDWSNPISQGYYPITLRSPYHMDGRYYSGYFFIYSDPNPFIGYWSPGQSSGLVYKWYLDNFPSDGWLDINKVLEIQELEPDQVYSVISVGRRTQALNFGDYSEYPIGQTVSNSAQSIFITPGNLLTTYPDPDFIENIPNPVGPVLQKCNELQNQLWIADNGVTNMYNSCKMSMIRRYGTGGLVNNTGFELIDTLVHTQYSGYESNRWTRYYDVVNYSYDYFDDFPYCQKFYESTMRYVAIFSGDNYARVFNTYYTDPTKIQQCNLNLNSYITGSVDTGSLQYFGFPIYSGITFDEQFGSASGFNSEQFSMSGLNVDIWGAYGCVGSFYSSIFSNVGSELYNIFSPKDTEVQSIQSFSQVSQCVVTHLMPDMLKKQFFSEYLPPVPVCQETQGDTSSIFYIMFYMFLVLFCLRTYSLFTKNPWHTEPEVEIVNRRPK